MSWEAIRSSITSRFQTQWGSTTPVKYANHSYVAQEGTTHVCIYILPAICMQVSLGDTQTYRTTGIITVNVYVPLNVGTKIPIELADTAAAIFRGKQFSDIQCRTPQLQIVGEIESWYVVSLDIPFYHDDSYTP